jgi:chromosome segregation ATPase
MAVAVGAMAVFAAAAGAAVMPGAGGKTQTLAELQAKFDHEENAVHKAKLIEKLGDAQFEALHAAEKAEDYNAAGLTLEKYRDNVSAALAGLKKERPDAERQSGGYRQLQMHLRRGIREVREALVTSPEEFKPPLELVEKDLTALDDELLRLLFPSPLVVGKPAKKEAKP